MNWKPLVRELIYPVQFEPHPVDAAPRVAERLNADKLDSYREALEHALSSPEPLDTLLPQKHSDATLRDYLRELQTRLQEAPTGKA